MLEENENIYFFFFEILHVELITFILNLQVIESLVQMSERLMWKVEQVYNNLAYCESSETSCRDVVMFGILFWILVICF